MAKVNARIANENFKSNEGNEFFSLKNDMDTATVRFLYEDENDLDTYIVHEVEINGKKRYVDCLQKDCPLCGSGNRPKLKLFLQLLDTRDNKVKTWERGQKFIPTILGLFGKYGALVNREYDIERHGAKGSTSTTYAVYALDKDNKKLSDFPEKQNFEGSYIIVMTAEEMKTFLETGSYNNAGISSNNENNNHGAEEPPSRRRRIVEEEDVF